MLTAHLWFERSIESTVNEAAIVSSYNEAIVPRIRLVWPSPKLGIWVR